MHFSTLQPTDLMSQASIYNTGTVTASTFGGGPFTRYSTRFEFQIHV